MSVSFNQTQVEQWASYTPQFGVEVMYAHRQANNSVVNLLLILSAYSNSRYPFIYGVIDKTKPRLLLNTKLALPTGKDTYLNECSRMHYWWMWATTQRLERYQ